MTLNWVRVEKKTEFVGVSRPQALALVSSIFIANIQTCASVCIGALGEAKGKNVFARICSRLHSCLPEEPLKLSQMWIYLITASSEVAGRIVHSPRSFTVSVSSRRDESGSHMLVIICAERPPATWHPEEWLLQDQQGGCAADSTKHSEKANQEIITRIALKG